MITEYANLLGLYALTGWMIGYKYAYKADNPEDLASYTIAGIFIWPYYTIKITRLNKEST